MTILCYNGYIEHTGRLFDVVRLALKEVIIFNNYSTKGAPNIYEVINIQRDGYNHVIFGKPE